MQAYGLHWFRRDLRISGNPALNWNSKQHQGRVLGVFFFDSSFLSRPDFSHSRFGFFLKSLAALQGELRQQGGDLLVLDALPAVGFRRLVGALQKTPFGKPAAVSFNRDYEPFARQRDTAVAALLERELGVETHSERDHLLIEPHEISPKDASKHFYQVYSPFARQWFERLRSSEVQARIRGDGIESKFSIRWSELLPSAGEFADRLQEFVRENAARVKIAIPDAGPVAALKQLDLFRERVGGYREARDFPAMPGTSRLSMFLKNGSITTGQIIAALDLGRQAYSVENGAGRFLKELVWREFYYHILYHCPRVETEAFNEKYRDIDWENDLDYFEAWKAGRTGYPIVDAGMRELAQTGWMHNRVRMIVASFLTKDLLIDWRWGERYFMEALLDGDLAPNNGGWQWAASTGCDPQPYFRIFNPTLQSERFDPDGEYIKRYLPERRGLSGKALHAPINPIVEHAVQKIAALKLYKT